MEKEQREVTDFIANYYGFSEQKEQLNEEMAELCVALNKFKRYAISNDYEERLNEVIEEIADVTIMLEQIKHLLKISDDTVSLVIYQKLKRQLDRIKQERRYKENEQGN